MSLQEFLLLLENMSLTLIYFVAGQRLKMLADTDHSGNTN